MIFFSWLISPWPHLLFWCSLFLLSLFQRALRKHTFILLQCALTIGFIMLFVGLMKLGFAKSRPNLVTNDFRAFPSGHAAIAFGLAGLTRRPVYFLLAMGLTSTRILLGYHDLIDVIVGSLIGVITATMIYSLTCRHRKQIEQAIGLLNLK